MLSKKIVLAFLAVSMLAFVAVGQAYARSNVAASGVAAFLDPVGDPGIVMVWNINDGTDGASSVSDWRNDPFQETPTWQITLPGVFGLNTVGISSWTNGDPGSDIANFVVEEGLSGKFSPVVSMRGHDYGPQSSVWFGPPSPPAYSWAGFSRANPGQDTVQILLTDTIRVTEFNTADVATGPNRPHVYTRLSEISAYDEGWPYDNVPVHTRPLSPTGVTLSADGKTLTWGGAVGASGYNVWISRAGVGDLSPDYFCVNQLPGPFSFLNDGMVTGTSYTLPSAWQGFAAGLYVVTSVDSTGTNSFYSDPATKEVGGGGLTAEQVQAMIDASLVPVLKDLADLGDEVSALNGKISALDGRISAIESDINAIIGAYNSHVHDKGSGSRNTTTPIPQIH